MLSGIRAMTTSPGWKNKKETENDSESDDGLGTENLESLMTETVDQLIARLKATNAPARNPAHPRPSDKSIREYYKWLADIGIQNTAENCLLTSLTTKYALKNFGSLQLFSKVKCVKKDVIECIWNCTFSKEKDIVVKNITYIEKLIIPDLHHFCVKWEDIILAGKAYALLKTNCIPTWTTKYDKRNIVNWKQNDKYHHSIDVNIRPVITHTVLGLPFSAASFLEEQRLLFREKLLSLLHAPFIRNKIDIDATTFGLKPQFINHLSLPVPFSTVVIVKNPSENGRDLAELIELFSRAGIILYIQWNARTTRIQYDHPLEAVQAISMFHMENIDGRVLEARMAKSPKDMLKTLVPPRFRAIGPGIGPNGAVSRSIRANNQLLHAKNSFKTEIKTLNEQITEVTNILNKITEESKKNDNNTEQEPTQQDFQIHIPDLSTVITSSIQNSLMGVTPLMQGLIQKIQNPHNLISPNWSCVQPVQSIEPNPQAVTAPAAATMSVPLVSTAPTLQPYNTNYMHTAIIQPTDVPSNIQQSPTRPVPPVPVVDSLLSNELAVPIQPCASNIRTVTNQFTERPFKEKQLVKPVTPVSSNLHQASRIDIPLEAINTPKSRFNVVPADQKQNSKPIAESTPLKALKRVSRFDIPPNHVSPPTDMFLPDTPFKNLALSSQPEDNYISPVAKNIGVVTTTMSQPNFKSKIITGSMYKKGSAVKAAFKILNPKLIPAASKLPEIKIYIPSLQPKPSSTLDLEFIPVCNPRKTKETDSSQLAAKSTCKRESDASPPRKVSKKEDNLSKNVINISVQENNNQSRGEKKNSKERKEERKKHRSPRKDIDSSKEREKVKNTSHYDKYSPKERDRTSRKEFSSKKRHSPARRDKEFSRKERHSPARRDKELSRKERDSPACRDKKFSRKERDSPADRDKEVSSKERDSPARRDKEFSSNEKGSMDNIYSYREPELSREYIKTIDARDIYSDLYGQEDSLCQPRTEEEPTKSPLHSTVIFKYLPPSVGTEDLREKMGEIGTILDVMKIGPGECMVCFLDIKDAKICIEMYHKSKVDNQTIEAKLAI